MNYLSEIGLESLEYQKKEGELDKLAADVVKAISGLEAEDVLRLVSKTADAHAEWLGSSKENYYDALYAETVAGTESAYITNRSLLKNAFIRFKMLFKFDKEKAVTEYADVLRNVDPEVINRGYADLVMDKRSVEAYNEIMHLANELSNGIDKKDLERMIIDLGNSLDGTFKKVLAAILLSYVPFLIFLTLPYLLYLNWTLPKEAEDMNRNYGEDIRMAISTAILRTSSAKKLGIKGKGGLLDTSELIKFVSHVNKLKADMIPMKHRRILSLPDMIKSTTPTSYEDRYEMASLIKNNANLYLDTLGSSPSKRVNAMRFVLSSDQITQNMEYGMSLGLASEEAIYAGLAETMMLTFIDTVSATMMLVRDLKKY